MESTYSKSRYCHVCGEKMNDVNNFEKTFIYKGQSVLVTGIKASVCPNCGEVVYSSEEAKRIEQIVRNATE